jgi:hypothetical protein
MQLYQYAVLLHPTRDAKESGALSKVILPPSKWMLAESEAEVVMKAGREIPEDYISEADRLEVAVRPF